MKKFISLAIAAGVALTASPAFAITTPDQSAWLQITPCEVTCLATATFDAETGSGLDEFVDTTLGVEYQFEAGFAEIDGVNSIAYFEAAGELYSYDLTTIGSATFLADESLLPTSSGNFRGLAMDNSTGKLYLSWYDDDEAHYFLSEFDPSTQSLVGDDLQLDDYLLSSDSYDVAISNGTLYVLNTDDEIAVIDLADGTLIDTIDYPLNSYNPNAIGTDVDGNLRVALYNEDDDYDVHVFVYNVTTNEWSDALDLNTQVYALAWWDRDVEAPADTSGGGLASTGVDASGIALAGAALVAAGAVVAVRRRARR